MDARMADLETKLKTLPDSPGCYIFKNVSGKILYIGKAKSLKNRVRSYFSNSHRDAKTARLVPQIADFDTLVTNNEIESFILEANLIHEYKPRYNIQLKDDKHFPYVKVTTNEAFPRVLIVRRLEKDGATYFGPYTSAKSMRQAVGFLTRLFTIRTCNLAIPSPSGKPYQVCLDYHIKRCGGPCAGFQSQEEYGELVKSLMMALKGQSKQLIERLTIRMKAASEEMNFEEAKFARDQIEALRTAMVKQNVDIGELVDRDIVALAREGTEVIAVVMQVRDGVLLGRQEFRLHAEVEDPDEQVLEGFIAQYYNHQPNLPSEILLPRELPEPKLTEEMLRKLHGARIRLVTPRIGEKWALVDLANTNARHVLDELLIQKKMQSDRTSKMVTSLKDELHLPESPRTMVCFDISNTGETDSVGSCVYFENGKPKKGEYRHFKIKGVIGQDDFTMMREIVGRYFFRLKEESKEPPYLVVVDGGKGQLSAAQAELLSLGFEKQQIISLAKRLEEVYLPGLSDPISIPKASPGLMLLKRVRDEAHRFAIEYNRKVRTKRTIQSELDSIPGVGPAKRFALLKEFGSVERIRQAKPEDLVKVKGITANLAARVLAHLGGSISPSADSVSQPPPTA